MAGFCYNVHLVLLVDWRVDLSTNTPDETSLNSLRHIIALLPDKELQTLWNYALSHPPEEYYDLSAGITIEEWQFLIRSQLIQRDLAI